MGEQGWTDFDVTGMNDLGANEIWATDIPLADSGPGMPVGYMDPQSSFVDGIQIDEATGQLYNADGSPVSPAIDASLRQAFGLEPAGAGFPQGSTDMRADSQAGMMDQQMNDGYDATRATNLSPQSMKILQDQEEMLSGDAQRVAAGQQPHDPSFWDKANKIVETMTGTALGRLGTAGIGAALSLLAQKAFVSTAKFKDPFRAQGGTLATQNNIFRDQINRESNISAEQAPAERQARLAALMRLNSADYGDPILTNEKAQMMRVMNGQYSNPLLDEQERQQQETLGNDWYHRGGRDALAESTGGQRAQMYQNLQNQAGREADRRSVLSQYQGDTTSRANADLARILTEAGVGRDTALDKAAITGAGTLDAQHGAGIVNGGLAQYGQQGNANIADRTAIGNVFGQMIGTVLGDSVRKPAGMTTPVGAAA